MARRVSGGVNRKSRHLKLAKLSAGSNIAMLRLMRLFLPRTRTPVRAALLQAAHRSSQARPAVVGCEIGGGCRDANRRWRIGMRMRIDSDGAGIVNIDSLVLKGFRPNRHGRSGVAG
jgi:hypothetical protein